MFQLLLIIIYLAFISLGLPDSLLGSAWTAMYPQLGVPVSYAGIISMIIAGGTILSSLFSDRLIRRLGTGLVTAVSVAMTAAALLGFSGSHTFIQLCLWSIAYGLGAGSVDSALNNFVALHYQSRHMSWLHCFWGIGATTGPCIIGLCLAAGYQWNSGYLVVGFIQIALVTCLLFSLPLWKTKQTAATQQQSTPHILSLNQMIRLPGAKAILTAFFCYCALEATTGLWAGSYLVLSRNLPPETAAKWTSLFYLGITLGRFICGFITGRLGDKTMVRCGQFLALAGIILLLLPLGNAVTLGGLILVGIGCAPIFPSLLHETPENFGAAHSQSIMGIQMASAYLGATFMPPLFGFIAEQTGAGAYPLYLLIFAVIMFIMVERMNNIHGTTTH